ncbi:hypothetical protein CTA2_7590 [Colletotrichum tanaceti]|uniref:Uncharacterized protein n=1 Tax=Colletotrichum tanaceti TaxID=1306861 RepID=A0A4U6XCM6_9PEZI|nr:hypothetical protein CTA2_7590 [Colletotrichum tanaceti]TKW53498.1 hypothetical protein CTA1_12406 [Colletotrichum tanaceti]
MPLHPTLPCHSLTRVLVSSSSASRPSGYFFFFSFRLSDFSLCCFVLLRLLRFSSGRDIIHSPRPVIYNLNHRPPPPAERHNYRLRRHGELLTPVLSIFPSRGEILLFPAAMQIARAALMTLAFLAVGTTAAPAPLNINLGAYSPALVVGDGALTFGGEGEVEAGKGKGGAGGEGAAAAAAAAAAASVPGAAQRGLIADRDIDKNSNEEMEKRQSSGFDRALTFAEVALTKGPKIQLGNGEGGAGVGIIVDNNPTAAAAARNGGAEGGEA